MKIRSRKDLVKVRNAVHEFLLYSDILEEMPCEESSNALNDVVRDLDFFIDNMDSAFAELGSEEQIYYWREGNLVGYHQELAVARAKEELKAFDEMIPDYEKEQYMTDEEKEKFRK